MKWKGHNFGLGRVAISAGLLLGLGISQTRSFAQDEYSTPPPAPETQLRPAAELDQLLGPIALYPDPLLGIILPAATVPAQIVTADRYVQGGGDTNQISVQPWDPSVQDLAHYPTVLKWMDDNLTWTTEIGVAFATQQNDVMDSIQRLRSQAQAMGNLQTTPQENVESDEGDIDIEPADPNDMYIPDYQADEIYTQPGVYCAFGLGLPIGGWLGFDWDWRRHHLITWTHDHPRPPDWWHRKPGGHRSEIPGGSGNLWRPQSRPASIIVAGAGDRGYEARGGMRPALEPKVSMPRGEAPRVEARGGVQPGVTIIGRQGGESHPPAGVTVIGRSEGESPRGRAFEPRVESPPARAVEPREEAPRARAVEPTESAFGGSQSPREVRESSSRGEASRAISTGGGRSGGGGGRR